MRRIAMIGSIVLLAPFGSVRAGVYGPDDAIPFAIRPDGMAEELPYVPNFKSMLDERSNAANPLSPLDESGKPTYRGRLVQRVETLWPAGGFSAKVPAKVTDLPLDRQVNLAADLIRLGRADEALLLLQPRSRDRNPDFRALVTLAQAHAAKGEWDLALKCHADAWELAELPVELPGATAAQTKWALDVEKLYVKRWLGLRKAEAESREPIDQHDVMPLFPIRFIGDRGEYEPGTLAAIEKAKLRTDAVAIVQQLLLWSPDDNRLLWLLAELTAAAGRLREASEIFDQCTWGRGFTNRKKLMDHRTLVAAAANAIPAAKPTDDPILDLAPAAKPDAKPVPQDYLPDTGTVVLVAALFGILVLALVALQVRAIVRRFNR